MNSSNITKNFTTTDDNNAGEDERLIEVFTAVTSYLWITLSPILFTAGMFGNISILIVLIRMKFWKKSTYVFLFILALADATVLSVGLSRYWVREVFYIDIRALTSWGCKINVFVIYASMQFSSAILVCVTFERFLKMKFPFRYNIIVSVKKSVMLAFAMLIFIIALNMFWLITQGLVEMDGDISCDALAEAYFWFEEFIYTYVDLSVLSIIPFVSMFVMNISIQRVLNQSKKLRKVSVSDEASRKELGKHSRVLTRMLLFTSTYFLISTIPISIYFIMDSYLAADADDLTLAEMDVVWAVTYLFQFSHYSANFFLYMGTNMSFRRHFILFWTCKTNRQESGAKKMTSSIQLSNSTFVEDDRSGKPDGSSTTNHI